MARIRTVKPEFWRSRKLAMAGDFVQLLAIALLNVADDEGYFLADPLLIRGEVFPYLEDHKKIDHGLTVLAKAGYIDMNHHPDKGWIAKVVNFTDHQRISHASRSRLRDFYEEKHDSGNFPEDSAQTPEDSGKIPEASAPEQGTGKGTGKGKEQGKETLFVRFWEVYPRRTAKGAAERAWDKATKLVSAEIIIAAAELFAQSDKGRGEYCPHPATWLNGKCWEDDPAMWTNRTSVNGKTTIREQATKDAVNDWLRSKQGGSVLEGPGGIGGDNGFPVDASGS